MARVEPDGGAKPTTPTKPAAELPSKTPVSTPAPTHIKLRRSGSGTTGFHRKPADDSSDTGSLASILHRSFRNKLDAMDRQDAPAPKPRKRHEGGSDPAIKKFVTSAVDEIDARIGAKTSNDGKVDGGVRHGSHKGHRDEQIDRLREKQQELREQRQKISDQIDDLNDDIDSGEKKSGLVSTAVGAMTSPVGLVSGLFGKKNPVAEGAENLAEHVLGVDDDKKELTEKQADLDAQSAEIQKKITALSNARSLNYLADVSAVSNLPEAVTQTLEGDKGLEIKVVDHTATGTDAAYDKSSDQIIFDDDALAGATAEMKSLQKQGIVDDDGNIVDADAFEDATDGTRASISTVSLTVHEGFIHAKSDIDGDIDRVTGAVQHRLNAAKQAASTMSADGAERYLAGAAKDAEMYRIDQLEYPAYLAQESVELQGGKKKQGFTTINPDGSLLPRKQAVANIYALQRGEAMVFGVSAGENFSTPGDSDEDSGDQTTPGKYTGGDDTPGKYTGGHRTPGKYTGGDDTPGKYTGGDDTPGKYTGGDETPGKYTGGDLLAGLFLGGNSTPGKYTGGDETPGKYTGGDLLAGLFLGGNSTPGKYTGGDETPGKYTGGDETPGKYTGGDYTPGKYTGGDETPGKYTGGDETPGKYTGGWLLG